MALFRIDKKRNYETLVQINSTLCLDFEDSET